MYISKVGYFTNFRAGVPDESIPSEAEFLQKVRCGEELPLSKVNKETGDTLFHTIVKRDYKSLVVYLYSRNIDFSKVLNAQNNAGLRPIDVAKSAEMELWLKRLEARNNMNSAQAAPNPAPNPAPADDAKIVATQQYMREPVLQKVETKIENEKPISFLDAFVEVPQEEIASENPQAQNDGEEVAEHQTCSTCGPKKSKVKGLEDFKLLEITDSDIQSIDDLIGLIDVKNELRTNIIAPLKNPNVASTCKKNQIDLPNGILFVGNGSALTTIKALSKEADLPVVIIESSQELPQIMTAVANRYKKHGLRTAILAQGFDKWWGQCTTCDDANANKFRNNIRGIKKKGGLFIATTTDKNFVCSDFMQSGIIDKVLNVSKPGAEDRLKFVKGYFAEKEIFRELSKEENISKIVELTDNLYYADIERILDETARTALAYGLNVDMDIFNEQLNDFSKETGRVPITEENRTASYDTEEMRRIPVTDDEPKSLDELAGMSQIKETLRDLYVEPMKKFDLLKSKLKNPKFADGAMFYGPPGNGKTLTAKTLARELRLPFYETSLADIATSYRDEELKRFKELADVLINKYKKTGEMSVWFLDEFDSIGTSRSDGGGDNSDKKLVDTILQIVKNPIETGILLIVATNNPSDIDPALKRGGRIGNWINFPNPNYEERVDLIKRTLATDEFTQELANNPEYINKLAKDFDGNANSDIVVVLNDAKRMAVIKDKDFTEVFKIAYDRHVERQMADFCNKAGLTQHKYNETDFKSLDELGGMREVINMLREFVVDAWNPEIRQALLANKRMPSGGFILEGPPGTGKTTVIETLAREMDIPLYKMNYNQEGNEYVYQMAKHIHEIFDRLALEAKILKKPVMLFFDEAEKFFPIMADRHKLEEVNTYKDLMNTAAAKGIILAGATNHIDLVNQEIIGNPRRMGTVIHVGKPNFDDRKDILKKLFAGLPIIAEDFSAEDIEYIATSTDGFSIGALSDAVDKIIVQAVKKKAKLTPEKFIREFESNIVPKQVL